MGIYLYPNSFSDPERYKVAQALAAEIYIAIQKGKAPTKSKNVLEATNIQLLKKGLESKLSQPFSKHHKTMLNYAFRALVRNTDGHNITNESVLSTLNHFDRGTSYNMMRRYLFSLINSAKKLGLVLDLSSIPKRKTQAKLHKPIGDIQGLLNEVLRYNYNLHLCCLLTYGCLLRPHREVRELTWGDFSENLNYIRLSGDRNKSGRNRIVPVPHYIKEFLKKTEDHLNIFSGKKEPFAPEYFKGLWGRFKKRSKLLEENQTLYSFRHTGAIDIYERTGSIEKLKAAMGHSDIMVSLTYLRGLDIAVLKEEDMPMI